MNEISFSNNYSDISQREGFQFEFYCEQCGDAWRTEFIRFMPGTVGNLLGAASSLLGGVLGSAGQVADYLGDAKYRSAHDKAFSEAVEQAKVHFKRCRKCGNYFCAQCFNPNLNLCTGCAPSIEEESNIAAREAEIEMVREKAQTAVKTGKRTTDGNIVCTACGARVAKAKFCSECGEKMDVKPTCSDCGFELQPGAKFCPECGAKQ